MTPPSLSDTNSDYQDVGHMSPPLSPNVHAALSDVHIQSSHVHSQHVSTHETGTQYVMTRSVSCDTYDISTPTQPSMGVGYDMQSSQSRPVSPQVNHGYFRSTPSQGFNYVTVSGFFMKAVTNSL